MAQRQLAAIMFSDIVGYTSLMNRDEKKAFDFIKKNRRIHWRLIKKYRGRWLKEMGDGILASFNSNMDAVRCAISIQQAEKELGIPLRIGIHQGDVIFEKKDVLGDGVNIASRVQGVADTNGVAISETVFNEVKNKEGIETEFIGRRSLEGVEKELGIYKVGCVDLSLLDHTVDTGELLRPVKLHRRAMIIGILVIALLFYAAYHFFAKKERELSKLEKSILVLPFDNYTGADTLEYFVAGMHDALIGDIGKISSLLVKSKTTANAYKNVDKPIPEIASELDVGVVVEGSVLCVGDSVCLQVKLLSAYPEERTVWVEDFKVELSQILNLYNTVTKEISSKINIYLTPQQESLLGEARRVDPEAYDAYLKGQYIWEQLNPETMVEAMGYFQKANDIDPTWAAPYLGLRMVWGVLRDFELIPRDSAAGIEQRLLDKALELDPHSANSHYVKAIDETWSQWDWEEAEWEFRKTLELNPNDALARIYYAHLLMILHRFDESLEQAERALERDPLRPSVLGLYAVVLIDAAQEYQSAIKYAEKAVSIDPKHHFAYSPLASAYLRSGQYEKWFQIWKNEFAWWDEEVLASIEKVFKEKGFPAAVEAIIEVNEEVFRNGGRISFRRQGLRYLMVGNEEKAMDYFEKAYDLKDGLLAYASLNPYEYPELRDNPRFIALMKKMNLPVD